MAIIGHFCNVLANLIFTINGTIEDNLRNSFNLHLNFAFTFYYFRFLSIDIIPKMRFLFTNKAEDELVFQLESDENVDSYEIFTENDETDEETDDIPPSNSKIYLISEN